MMSLDKTEKLIILLYIGLDLELISFELDVPTDKTTVNEEDLKHLDEEAKKLRSYLFFQSYKKSLSPKMRYKNSRIIQ